MNEDVVEVEDLTKRYGRQTVVDQVSFTVRRGEIFGLIGPNGAGKTTTMECIEGLRKPDAGDVRVLGMDPHRDPQALKQLIGVQLQEAQLQKRIKVWEILDLMSSLYDKPLDGKALLEQLGLSAKLNDRFLVLSGGQKQRLFIALALINDPEVVFLDELTTGLDPQARHAIWDLITAIRDRGKTVFLTTHLMEEAERLCDRVAIIEEGRLIAMDTPKALVKAHCPEIRLSFSCTEAIDAETFQRSTEADSIRVENGEVTLSGQGGDFVSKVIDHLASESVRVTDFHTERPNLESVFLKLTGHSVRE